MPQIYRSMREEDGKPILGQETNTLGVRPGIDIAPQLDGTVQPDTGGMSVSPAPGALPPFKIPRRLRDTFAGSAQASGRDDLRIWKMGDGPFQNAPLAAQLVLTLEDVAHGFVEPDAVMPFEQYETALQNTRDDWEIDEGGTQP